jgi:hypothetical protein
LPATSMEASMPSAIRDLVSMATSLMSQAQQLTPMIPSEHFIHASVYCV